MQGLQRQPRYMGKVLTTHCAYLGTQPSTHGDATRCARQVATFRRPCCVAGLQARVLSFTVSAKANNPRTPTASKCRLQSRMIPEHLASDVIVLLHCPAQNMAMAEARNTSTSIFLMAACGAACFR